MYGIPSWNRLCSYKLGLENMTKRKIDIPVKLACQRSKRTPWNGQSEICIRYSCLKHFRFRVDLLQHFFLEYIMQGDIFCIHHFSHILARAKRSFYASIIFIEFFLWTWKKLFACSGMLKDLTSSWYRSKLWNVSRRWKPIEVVSWI